MDWCYPSPALGNPDSAEAAAASSGNSRIADGIIEAGWLLALALVPVFFNVHSGRPFEPDKAALLRLLALLVAAAGIARWVEDWLGGWRPTFSRWRESPLFICAALYLGASAVSTALSIEPRLSLWGSHARLDGLLTLLANLTIFVSVATRLRRREQLQRLVDVIVAASLPVCVYGFMQRLGFEPLEWRVQYQEWRISTTLGNPIFVGSYLILVLPVTLAGVLAAWRRRGERRDALRVALYAAAAASQLVALGLTGSRGPWLGGAAGLAAFVLLHAAVRGRRRLAAATLAVGLIGLAFVALLNVPGGPLERLRNVPMLSRLGRLFDRHDETNPGDRARVLVWEGALRLIRSAPALVVPGRGPDPRASLRPLIGYGPETLQAVYGAVYDSEFARIERRNPDITAEGTSVFSTRIPDRSHNEVLDSLVMGGLLGLCAYLLLAAAAQIAALGALGLFSEHRERLKLYGLCAAGALFALLGARAFGWFYVGVALPLGLVAGWMVFVLWTALRRRGSAMELDSALLIGLAAALLGHFVESQFGPAVTTARLYFWGLAGVLVALPRLRALPEEAEVGAPAPASVRAGLLAAALCVTIIYGFAGLKAGGVGRASYGAMMLLAGISVAALASTQVGPSLRGALVAVAVAGTIALAYGRYHLHALSATSQVRSLTELVTALTGYFTTYVLLIVLLTIALGVALGWARMRRPTLPGSLRTAVVVLGALWIAVPPSAAAVNADVLRNFGSTFQAQGRWREALGSFEASARLGPRESLNFQGLGEALLAATRVPASGIPASELLRRAEAAFTRARDLNPLALDHTADLARLARRRSELEPDASAARRYADDAARHYADARALVPGNTLLLNESAELDFTRRGDFATAEQKLQHSLELDPTFDYTYAALGDLYMARARESHGREDWARAAEAYQAALGRRRSLKAIISLGLVSKELGDSARAVAAFSEALQMGPPQATAWALHEQLTALYLAQGNRPQAEQHAALALSQAPEKEKAGLAARLTAAQLPPAVAPAVVPVAPRPDRRHRAPVN